ncbi:hypothetical protein OS493_020755 [Desmophyllum pertusum]|uniref:Uncharacterized protein n=1 Tax=Desmophyllum pertusum TaxID=174260 RepID=A0A9W9YQT3_9CNID|nr:hypothetical protein OS493_020755 [Desmophyllum pertusum]
MNTTTFLLNVGLQLVLCSNIIFAEKRQNICQDFKFVLNEDVVNDHALDGHVFQRHTVKTAAQCHMMCRDDCLCVSMNYLLNVKENNCELNDVGQKKKPDALKVKHGAQYYDLVRSYAVEGGRQYVPGKDRCVNRCCESNPCFHGQECQEICDPNDVRFNCTCSANYIGQRCEHRCYRSCKEVFETGVTQSGRYIICDGEIEPFHVYCDIESESDYVWTLIQSFSFARNFLFQKKPFGDDYPVGEDLSEVDWTNYRLSFPRMKYLATQSTHLRATCNFATEGHSYTDYARAKLANHTIFTRFERKCRQYERLNIRGIQCYVCTALTNQSNGKSWFINSYTSKTRGCQFDGRPGMGTGEYNFGSYPNSKVNPDHRCSSSPSSTTEHWFGNKKG